MDVRLLSLPRRSVLPEPQAPSGSDVARGPGLQSVLQDVAEVTVWTEAFNLGEYSLDDLREAATAHDFAAFVFSPRRRGLVSGPNDSCP